MPAAVVRHPERREVLPPAPEPVDRTDGDTRNDCGRNAAARSVDDLRRGHRRLNAIVLQDGPASSGPHIARLRRHGLRSVPGGRPGDHALLFASPAASPDTRTARFTDADGVGCHINRNFSLSIAVRSRATPPPCLRRVRRRVCGMARHGTYGRRTPVPMHVARFHCPACRTTFSLLPDFAAARRPGSLQEIGDGMAVLARSRGPWAAARQLFPERGEMSNAVRGLRGAFAEVSAFLAAVVTLHPDLFPGCPAELPAMRTALGTETLPVDLRQEISDRLWSLPPLVGFRPPRTGGKLLTVPPNRE